MYVCMYVCAVARDRRMFENVSNWTKLCFISIRLNAVVLEKLTQRIFNGSLFNLTSIRTIIMDFFVILSILLVILGIYYLLRPRNPFEVYNLPHKSSFPLLGSTWESILTRKSFATVVQEIYNLIPDAKYVGLYNRMTPVLMIRDEELIKSITIKNFDYFRNHRNFINEQIDSFFSSNLLLLRDDRWRNVRSLFTPAFSSSKMRSMFQLMSETAVNMAKYLSTLPANENVVEMKDIFTRYANDVFATCAFGIVIDSLADRKNKFYTLGREALDIHSVTILKLIVIKIFPGLARRFGITLLSRKVTNFFKQVVSDSIKVREEKGIVRPDFIQLMMETKGFETTSGLLCFAAHEVAVNPEVQKRLHAEIDCVLADSNRELTFEIFNSRLEYLDAVINETVRMYPIIPITDRECSKSFELPPVLSGAKPYVMNEGSHLWLPIYAIQRDPKYFEKPNTFDPDRFLDKKSNLVNSGVYLPFGMGPRNCIAKRFALMEAKVALFHIFARCRLEVCSETTMPMELKTRGVFLTAKNGFWLRIVPRNI
ncbi:cytochrome P450 9e2-like isoform X2 [Bombus pyrosoma]|uniref:cytochrome P450 9e2-like isoform X2 n=1 Tax=Bombus pyrosoma TaxID=396416 RepID=UPI001CB98207|nr:cytochrome P450 9e2-like isoform X2 [Bombus pyrosoma]